MIACNVCGDGKRKSKVFRLCLECFWKFEKSAVLRGSTLLEPPVLGEADERTIDGHKFWFWKDTWRVEKKS